MPTLPIRTVTRPAVLSGQTNGKLSNSILLETPGLAGGPVVRLVAPAARAWRALAAAARTAGHVLKMTSEADSYRSYEVQERIFRQRYTTGYIPGVETKVWLGQTWYKRTGYATAAVPGTSNHGWGLAGDIGEERDGDSGTESIDSGTLAWLIVNAGRFGFSGELQSEPWHWRYFAGDAIPAAVLAFEEDEDMPTAQEIKTAILNDGGMQQLFSRVYTLSVQVPALQAEVTLLRGAVAGIVSGDADTAAILQGMDERLAAFRAQVEADTRDAVADLAEGGAEAVRADA